MSYNKKHLNIVGVIAVTGLCLINIYYLSQPHTNEPIPHVATTLPIDNTQNQLTASKVEQLEHKLDELQQMLLAATQSQSSTTPTDSVNTRIEPEPTTPHNLHETPLQLAFNNAQSKQEEYDNALRATSYLDEALTTQEYDPRWAPEVESTVERLFESSTFTMSQLSGFQCMSNLCRLDITHQNVDAEQTFLQQFFVAGNFGDTEAFFVKDEQANGQSYMTFYFTRDGYRLP